MKATGFNADQVLFVASHRRTRYEPSDILIYQFLSCSLFSLALRAFLVASSSVMLTNGAGQMSYDESGTATSCPWSGFSGCLRDAKNWSTVAVAKMEIPMAYRTVCNFISFGFTDCLMAGALSESVSVFRLSFRCVGRLLTSLCFAPRQLMRRCLLVSGNVGSSFIGLVRGVVVFLRTEISDHADCRQRDSYDEYCSPKYVHA